MTTTPNPSFDLDALRATQKARGEKHLWRGLEDLADTAEHRAFLEHEFPNDPEKDAGAGAGESDGGVHRRDVLKWMAASAALAGLAGCTKMPEQKIVPYVRPPEEIIPGRPLFYATSMTMGGVATGILVESNMGRPTKVEGNPLHPASLGATDIFAAEFAPDGTLSGATYLGGSGTDAPSAVVALGGGNINLLGTTNSSDFPGIVDAPTVNLTFVASLLINNPNNSGGPCLAFTIQNGASFAEGAVAPGEVVTLRGVGLGPQTGVNAQAGPDGFPTELAGVEVLFGNQPAPLLYVQSQQINAVVPWNALNSFNPGTSVQVKYNGASVSGSTILNQAAPGIFLANYTTKLAAVTNADGTVNSPTNPAKVGSVVTFYGTGGGPMNPPGVDGGIWPSNPLAQFTLPVSVQMDITDATVIYAGSAPGLVSGIFQINVKVPNIVPVPNIASPPSTVPLVIMEAGVSSTPGSAFIAVQ